MGPAPARCGCGACAAAPSPPADGTYTVADAPRSEIFAYTDAAGVPARTISSAFRSSSSTRAWNAGSGWAPVSLRPFTKKEGVPEAPRDWTSFWSRSRRALYLPEAMASFTFAGSRPASLAAWRIAASSREAAAKSASCIAQNFASPPCARASSVASAAGVARAWNGSGLCLKTNRTLPRYCSSSALSVGATRLQNGHSKSDDSTIVTSASAGPFTGESSRGTR